MKRKRTAEKETLPEEIREEIAILMRKLKNVLDSSKNTKPGFGGHLIEQILLVGVAESNANLHSINKLIGSLYTPKITTSKKFLDEEDREERITIGSIAYDLTKLLVGEHEIITSQKQKVFRQDVEATIFNLFFEDSIDKKESIKLEKIELIGVNNDSESGEM